MPGRYGLLRSCATASQLQPVAALQLSGISVRPVVNVLTWASEYLFHTRRHAGSQTLGAFRGLPSLRRRSFSANRPGRIWPQPVALTLHQRQVPLTGTEAGTAAAGAYHIKVMLAAKGTTDPDRLETAASTVLKGFNDVRPHDDVALALPRLKAAGLKVEDVCQRKLQIFLRCQ